LVDVVGLVILLKKKLSKKPNQGYTVVKEKDIQLSVFLMIEGREEKRKVKKRK